MSAVLDVPALDSWFLLRCTAAGAPSVVMEFGTRVEAERALREIVRDLVIAERDVAGSFAIRSALEMIQTPDLQEPLRIWDLDLT
jgi:hypothetical protein